MFRTTDRKKKSSQNYRGLRTSFKVTKSFSLAGLLPLPLLERRATSGSGVLYWWMHTHTHHIRNHSASSNILNLIYHLVRKFCLQQQQLLLLLLVVVVYSLVSLCHCCRTRCIFQEKKNIYLDLFLWPAFACSWSVRMLMMITWSYIHLPQFLAQKHVSRCCCCYNAHSRMKVIFNFVCLSIRSILLLSRSLSHLTVAALPVARFRPAVSAATSATVLAKSMSQDVVVVTMLTRGWRLSLILYASPLDQFSYSLALSLISLWLRCLLYTSPSPRD